MEDLVLITDKNLKYEDKLEFDAFNQFYKKEENVARVRHIEEWMQSENLVNVVRPRLEELEKRVGPYISVQDDLEGMLPFKSSMHNYIAQIKYGIFAQDNYEVDLKPQDDDPKTIERVEKLNLVLRTELIKARANKYVKEALLTSRKSLFGATLITWKNPAELGENDTVSASPFELQNIAPKRLYWDPKWDKIEKMDYVYVLSQTTWWEICAHPVLGKKKELLKFIQGKYGSASEEPKNFDADATINNAFNNTSPKPDISTEEQTGIALKTKFWLKNKGTSKQECMVSYFIGQNILLGTYSAGCSILPVVMLYEFKNPGDFYGSSTIFNLNSHIVNYELLLQKEFNNAQYAGSKHIFLDEKLKLNRADLVESSARPGIQFHSTKETPIQGILTVDPSAIDQTTLAFLQDQERLIYQMAGIDKIVQGETGSLQTQSGVAGVLQEARLLDESCLSYLEDYIERFNSIALEYITKKYNGIKNEAKIRVQRSSSQMDEQGVDYDFITIPKGSFKDLKVDILPSFNIYASINRNQSLSTLMQLVTLDTQRPPGEKIFTDTRMIAEMFKNFFPNYREIQLSQARANSKKWANAGQATTQFVMNQLANQQQPTDIGDGVGDVLQNLAGGGGLEEQQLEPSQDLAAPQDALAAGGGLPQGAPVEETEEDIFDL